ncbi:hypothetical protein VHA_000555 [Grimontia hollisae CIP 101886]|uniref:Uncharacterized protein n=1 Tax=Grimontia hollisae CIP 101886 TaxID=675812 RepID=D0I490_GRIHO|nr:hypothetical protein VHA_000555 [Grimontia hollisae CIP 101886]
MTRFAVIMSALSQRLFTQAVRKNVNPARSFSRIDAKSTFSIG